VICRILGFKVPSFECHSIVSLASRRFSLGMLLFTIVWYIGFSEIADLYEIGWWKLEYAGFAMVQPVCAGFSRTRPDYRAGPYGESNWIRTIKYCGTGLLQLNQIFRMGHLHCRQNHISIIFNVNKYFPSGQFKKSYFHPISYTTSSRYASPAALDDTRL
jgi:hypothetical protein